MAGVGVLAVAGAVVVPEFSFSAWQMPDSIALICLQKQVLTLQANSSSAAVSEVLLIVTLASFAAFSFATPGHQLLERQ
jgi:hypothetical protein